jgi:hypothetical protein
VSKTTLHNYLVRITAEVQIASEPDPSAASPRAFKPHTNARPADWPVGPPTQDLSGLPPMPWYPAWFAQSTSGWPRIAKAVYRELLDTQWLSGDLPENPREISTMINATETEWAYWSSHIQGKFPVHAGVRRNPTLAAFRIYALWLHERRRAGARAANARRWRRSEG